MSKPTVHGAGDDGAGDNPTVTSKFDRSHGMPRTPEKVEGPGGMAEPPKGRHAPTHAEHAEHGTVHHYAPDHPAMGGLHAGARAKHPTHDSEQAAYEKHGHGGKRD